MLFDTYLDYFENLAVQNKEIRHIKGADVKGFFWILVSVDPFPLYYLDHLYNAQRNEIPADKPFMVLENYIAEPDVEHDGDNKTEFMGAFMIMTGVTKGDVDEEKAALAYTEKIARQIIARMKLDMVAKCEIELLNRFKYEHVGPAMDDSYFGTKVHFGFKDAEFGMYDVVDSDWDDL